MIANVLIPRKLVIGGGAVGQAGGLLRGFGFRNALVVTDKFQARSAGMDALREALRRADVRHEIYDETVPDPTTKSVEECTRAMVAGRYDSVVALGGGSPMDTAKACCMLAKRGGKMRDYKAPFVNDDEKNTIPLIAIPTTAGTGSEVTKFTIITDSETDEKMLCIGAAYMPLASIVDYELTVSMPFRLTADTGIDAFCHAMEAYVSRRHNPFSDAFALRAVERIASSLQTACEHPTDLKAREMMMLASTEAGIAFSNSSVTLIHGMSRPIGANFHVAHGLSNAMLAPEVTRFSVRGAVERYAAVARAAGFASPGADDASAAASVPEKLKEWSRRLKVPTLAEFGVKRDVFERVVEKMATAALASGSPNNNPVVPDARQIVQLYRDIYDGRVTEV